MKLPSELAEMKRVLQAATAAWDDVLMRARQDLDVTEAFPTAADVAAAEPPAPPPEPGPRRDELVEQMKENWPEGKKRNLRRWWRRR